MLELCRFNILEDIQKSVKPKMSKIKIGAMRLKDLCIERFLSEKIRLLDKWASLFFEYLREY